MNDLLQKQIAEATDNMKDHYDIRAETDGFQVGDKIWLCNPALHKGYSPKLQINWEVPQVIKNLNDICRIRRSP